MPITLERTPEQTQLEAKALFDCGLSKNAIVHRTGLHWTTLNAILARQTFNPIVLERVKARQVWKAYRLADDVQDLITVEEIKKAPLGVKMMAYGIAIDKARDMEGSNRPVFNIVSIVNETQTAIGRINKQMAAITSTALEHNGI